MVKLVQKGERKDMRSATNGLVTTAGPRVKIFQPLVLLMNIYNLAGF
jgi:hypothetical protein